MPTTGLEIFLNAKKEIYDVLRKDAFQRFIKTEKFKTFIQKFEPYEQQYLYKSPQVNNNEAKTEDVNGNPTSE
jgi:hypothetical protein